MLLLCQDSVVAELPDGDKFKHKKSLCSFRSAHEHAEFSGQTTDKSAAHSASKQTSDNRIAIILGYFNGEAYIADQLQSILKQSHQALHIFIFDDQSSNPFIFDTVKLDAEQYAKISIAVRPENIGFSNNYLHALASIDEAFEYFAFSDQDDVWRPRKLEKAIAALSDISPDIPALYCARTEIVDTSCKHVLGCSPIFRKPPCFANALVQNMGGGNTMVFNKAARDVIVASLLNSTVVSHDWWCYQIVTGVGGTVVYDPAPCLKYRRHANNLMGDNIGWSARFLRICRLLQGHFRIWNDTNLKALAEHKHLLTADNLRILNDFTEARQSHLLKRLALFKRSGVYRQTLFGNLGLLLGILLNKV